MLVDLVTISNKVLLNLPKNFYGIAKYTCAIFFIINK